jgi:hypothetical protein
LVGWLIACFPLTRKRKKGKKEGRKEERMVADQVSAILNQDFVISLKPSSDYESHFNPIHHP